jgi:hypothetical protein
MGVGRCTGRDFVFLTAEINERIEVRTHGLCFCCLRFVGSGNRFFEGSEARLCFCFSPMCISHFLFSTKLGCVCVFPFSESFI